jgi:adenosylhomocysteine nucleosidase
VLVTADTIANISEKERLLKLYGAAAVDMEAITVGRLASEHGLSFGAIKAISDEADFEIEGLSQFATQEGQFREAAFALHAALRPAVWRKVIALGRNSRKALAALTVTLRGELDWYRQRA